MKAIQPSRGRSPVHRKAVPPARSLLFFAAMVFATVGMIASAESAEPNTFVWNGDGGDDFWTNPENWSHGQGLGSGPMEPAQDGTAEIAISGTSRPESVVNNAWVVKSITFIWSAKLNFTLKGDPLTICGTGIGIQDRAATPQTISNDIMFEAEAPTINLALAKQLVLTGKVQCANRLVLRGAGRGLVRVAESGLLACNELEVTAAFASYGDCTLQVDSAKAFDPKMTLLLTAHADGKKHAKVDLNFEGIATIAELVVDGKPEASGTFDATARPELFLGKGQLEVTGKK